MANKSHTIKLGVDSTDFNKGLKAADKSIIDTTKQVKSLKDGLKIEWDSSRFVKAQELAQKALVETEQKAESIRVELTRLKDVEAVDSAQYQKLQNELIKTENKTVLLRKELEKINNLRFETLGKSITDVGNKVSKAGRSLSVFSAAAAGALIGAASLAKGAVKAGDDIATASAKFDLSAKEIQRWQYIALQTDVPAEQLFKSAVKIRDAFGEQTTGKISNATKALDELGININNFRGNEDAFKATLIALSQIEDSTLQAYYANELFGEKVATDIIPLLKGGAKAIEEYSKEFEAVGYLSDENVKKLAELDNALNKATAEFEQAKIQLGIALIPVLKIFAEILTKNVVPAIQELAKWFESLSPEMQKTIVTVLAVIAVIGPLVFIVGKLIGVVGGIISLLPTLTKLIQILGTTTGRAFISLAAFGAVIFLISEVMQNWGNMSAFEQIISVLGVLTVVAFGAAIAMGAFHSAWSLGLAIVGIIAGIAAVTASINGAKNSVEGLDVPDFNVPNVTGGGGGGGMNMPEYDPNDVLRDSTGGGGSSNQDNSVVDNSVVTINIYDAEQKQTSEIIEEINKYFAEKKLGYR